MHIKHKYNLSTSYGALLFLSLALGTLPAVALGAAAKKEEKPQAEATKKPATAPKIGSAGSYLSSQYARGSGNVDAAISYLSAALAKNPENTGLASQLLAMQVLKGDFTNALVNATSLEKKNIRDPLSDLLISVTLIKNKNYAGASKKLTEAFDTANGQLWLPLVDAWVDAGKGNIKQPILLEEMPVTVGRAASVMNYHLALINAFAGFNDQAAINFVDAVEEPETAPMRIMQQAEYLSVKHPELVALKEIVQKYHVVHPGALPELESPIKTPLDGVSEVLYTMGSVMQLAGVQHDAAVYMQLALYLRPDFHLASFALAEILTDQKAYERASALLSAIPASSQYALKAALRQGLILDKMGKTPEALEVLAGLAARQPKATEPWIARGDLLRVHDRFLEASIAYTEALNRSGELQAKDWPVLYARGSCFERLDRWNDAKADFRKALALNPDQPDVLNYLGYGMLVRGEALPEAKAMLEKAIAASPNDPQIIDSMGWALHLLGQYKQALPFLERAVELLPGDATVNDHLGDNYWRLDRKNEARFQWQRALTFVPDAEESKKINTKLSAGLPSAAVPHNTKSASANPAATAIP